MLQFPHLRRIAEANDLAVPFRRLDIVRQHQHAVLWQALRDAYLLAPDRFQAAELFQMHRLHVHDQRDRRLCQFAEPRDLAGLVHAHFDDPDTCVGLALHSVSGTPQKLLKLLGLA